MAPETVLVLYGVYWAVAFCGRIVLQLIRTGDTGLRGVGRTPVERLAAFLFLGGIVVQVAAPVIDMDDSVERLFDSAATDAAGIALFALGAATTVLAQVAMDRSWRIGVRADEHTELVTGGPFAVVRNPIYSGMIPAMAGLALLVPNAVSFVGLAMLVAGLQLHTRAIEEPYLLRQHGRAYEEYARRVGRFVPGIGRLRGR